MGNLSNLKVRILSRALCRVLLIDKKLKNTINKQKYKLIRVLFDTTINNKFKEKDE